MFFLRRLRSARAQIMERFYLRRRAEGIDAFLWELQHANNTNLCFSIAFNTPWVIDYLTRLWQKNVVDAGLAVIDNSSSHTAATTIKTLCASRGVPYLKLPKSYEWNPNLSHGQAGNWIFYNVVRNVRPLRFGFVDHDCFPIVPFRLEEQFSGKKIYGLHIDCRRTKPINHRPLNGPQPWSLWAGYSFMDFSYVENRMFDFNPLHHLGLDTGGSNWFDIYSRIVDTDARFARYERVTHQEECLDCQYELIDGAFLHVGGASYSKITTKQDYVRGMQSLLQSTYL